MSKLIKIGDEYFTVGTEFNLEKTEKPEGDVEATDTTEIAKQIADATPQEAYALVVELKEAYTTLQKAAVESGKNEDHVKRLEALEPFAVANHFYNEKLELTGGVTDVAEIVEPPKAEDGDKEDADAGEEKPAEKDGDKPEDDSSDTEDVKVEVPDDISSLDEDSKKELVQAAAVIVANQNRSIGDLVSSDNRRTFVQPDAVIDRQANLTELGDLKRDSADFVMASGFGHVDSGTRLSGMEADTAIAAALNTTFGGKGRNRQAIRQTLGHYEMFGPTPDLLSPELAMNRVATGGKNLTRTAAGELCDTDERRELPDCHDFSGDLTGLVETYAAPHCNLKFLKDISMADVKDGVRFWTEDDKAAYCEARDAFKAAQLAKDAAGVTAAWGAMKAAEKTCIDTGCLEFGEPITMLPIYACIEWSIEQQQCSPEHVARYRRLLQKAFTRIKNAHFLAALAAEAITVNVDASAAPFINADGIQLDAACVVDQVLCELEPQGLMAERLTGGNYTAIIPAGLAKALSIGNRKACSNLENEVKGLTGVSRVITALDVAATAEDICPEGPYPVLPEPGTPVDFADVRLPTDWNILFVDLDDYFQISRPDIELGAQITHNSAKGNWVEGEFMETFVGYGKDGCHPAWNINLSNLCYNGARAGCISPAGLC